MMGCNPSNKLGNRSLSIQQDHSQFASVLQSLLHLATIRNYASSPAKLSQTSPLVRNFKQLVNDNWTARFKGDILQSDNLLLEYRKRYPADEDKILYQAFDNLISGLSSDEKDGFPFFDSIQDRVFDCYDGSVRVMTLHASYIVLKLWNENRSLYELVKAWDKTSHIYADLCPGGAAGDGEEDGIANANSRGSFVRKVPRIFVFFLIRGRSTEPEIKDQSYVEIPTTINAQDLLGSKRAGLFSIQSIIHHIGDTFEEDGRYETEFVNDHTWYRTDGPTISPSVDYGYATSIWSNTACILVYEEVQ